MINSGAIRYYTGVTPQHLVGLAPALTDHYLVGRSRI